MCPVRKREKSQTIPRFWGWAVERVVIYYRDEKSKKKVLIGLGQRKSRSREGFGWA